MNTPKEQVTKTEPWDGSKPFIKRLYNDMWGEYKRDEPAVWGVPKEKRIGGNRGGNGGNNGRVTPGVTVGVPDRDTLGNPRNRAGVFSLGRR